MSDDRPRLFARVYHNGWAGECPACGQILGVSGRARYGVVWDVRTSCAKCTHCEALWIVGLAFSRVKNGPRRPALPRDQVPKRAQLEALRAWERERRLQGGLRELGQVETDTHTRPLRTHYVEECTCSYLAEPLQHVRQTDPECPLHGQFDNVD